MFNLRPEAELSDIIRQIREELSEGHPNEPITIKLIIISHAGVDHYKWLLKVFNAKDKIGGIIIGGRPESYDVSGKLKLNEWLQTRIDAGTKVYFPSISYEPISSLSQVLPSESRKYTLPWCSNMQLKFGEQPKFDDLLQFGDGISISFLAINPTQSVGVDGTILRLGGMNDDNVDSLAIRVQYGLSSVTIMGDSTGVMFNS